MPRRHMAALTQHRHPHDQHPVVRRPVRVVAGGAVLSNRCVLPQHRPAHFRVAADAHFGDRASGLQFLDVADRAMRVVTRRTGHLAFAHGHVCDGALGLGDLQPMARRAHSVCVVLTSCCSADFGLWTLWHVVQEDCAARARCLPIRRGRRGCDTSSRSGSLRPVSSL